MTTQRNAPLILVAFGLLGCSEADRGDYADAELDGRAGSLSEQVCPGTRQIAESQVPNGCPNVQGWSTRSLFERGSPWLASHDLSVPNPLDTYCRYDYDPSQHVALPGALANLGEHDGLVEVGPDCEVVFGEAQSVLSEAVAPVLRDFFASRIGRPSAQDLSSQSGASTEQDRASVSVAVVDSMPFSMPQRPRSKHGETMARIITDIACPDGTAPCAVDVDRILALPRYADGVDFQHGGVIGSQGDLAAAIIETVQRHRLQIQNGGDPAGLVINLSLGWDSAFFGGSETDNPAPVDAVQRALEYASCHGALIIAAAGNASTLCTDGPLAPALWEELPAPDAAHCGGLGAPTPAAGGSYRPLVYAVGGLSLDGTPMPGSREDGMPRLAAAADHAVAHDPATKALTGTSVSAAVVSATAALVWSYRPDLTVGELMDVIYDSGTPSGLTASFSGPGAPNTAVVAAHACNALEAACAGGVGCPDLDLQCATPPDSVDLGLLSDAIDGLSVVPTLEERTFDAVATPCAPVCGSDVDAVGVEGADACAAAYVDPTDRFTNPQPNDPACSTCTLEQNTSTVTASLDPDYSGDTIANVTVSVDDGSRITRYDFGEVDLTADGTSELDLGQSLSNVQSASISISFTKTGGNGRPVENYLLVH